MTQHGPLTSGESCQVDVVQRQSFAFPGTEDKAVHFEGAIPRPQDAQHLRTIAPRLEPVG